jgi:hypothetical protein
MDMLLFFSSFIYKSTVLFQPAAWIVVLLILAHSKGCLSLLLLGLVAEEVLGSNGTSEKSETGSDLGGVLLALLGLEVLLLLLAKDGVALSLGVVVGDGGIGVLSWDDGDGQVNVTLLLAVFQEKREPSLQGPVLGTEDLVQGDGVVTNGLINQLLLIEDTNEEIGVAGGIEVLEDSDLVPLGMGAGVLLGGSLPVAALVIAVDEQNDIGVVLAETLMIDDR